MFYKHYLFALVCILNGFLAICKCQTPVFSSTLVASTSTANPIKSKHFKWIPNGVKNGLASAMATSVTKVALQPFDTIKTIQQLQKIKLNALATGIEIVQSRGIAGLWSGVGVSVIGSSPSVACYFGVYSAVKSRLIPIFPAKYRLLAIAIAAVIGNSLASILRVPYEIFKQRIQAGEHKTILEAVNYSIKNEGLIGLFGTGKLSSQIIRDVPYAVITLVSYELLQSYLNKRNNKQTTNSQQTVKNSQKVANLLLQSEDRLASTLEDEGGADTNILMGAHEHKSTPASKITATSQQTNNNNNNANNKRLQDGVCGSLAGGLGALCTTPMDVVKTRLMTSNNQYTSILHATASILKDEGLGTFFMGTSSRLLHKIPANGLFFVCYESFRSLLGVEEEVDM